MPQIRAGTIKALGVTTKQRVPGFENIPTIAEQGLPDYETYSWNGFLAPAGTPPAVIAKLNAEANKAIADPGVKAKLTDISAVTVGTTPEELATFIQKELAVWEPVIRGATSPSTDLSGPAGNDPSPPVLRSRSKLQRSGSRSISSKIVGSIATCPGASGRADHHPAAIVANLDSTSRKKGGGEAGLEPAKA